MSEFQMGNSLVDAEMATDALVPVFERRNPVEHVDRSEVESPETDGSAIPDFIGEGIEHFESHPSVDGPVEFRRAAGSTIFRASVRDASGGTTLVQESGQTIEAAWHLFVGAMSTAITQAASGGRT